MNVASRLLLISYLVVCTGRVASQDSRLVDTVKQLVGETEQAKCSYAIANGLTNILGKLSGCHPPPPGLEPPVPVPPQFTSPPPLVPTVPAPGMPGAALEPILPPPSISPSTTPFPSPILPPLPAPPGQQPVAPSPSPVISPALTPVISPASALVIAPAAAPVISPAPAPVIAPAPAPAGATPATTCPLGSSFAIQPFSNGDFESGVAGSSTVPGWINSLEAGDQASLSFALFSGGPEGQFVQKLSTDGPGSYAIVSGYFISAPTTSVTFKYQVQNSAGTGVYPDTFSSSDISNQQARVDVYDASDPRICSLADYLYDSASAEAGPYLGTILSSVTVQANSGSGWLTFNGIIGPNLVGEYGKAVVLAFRQVDTQAPFQLSIDSVSFM